MPLINEACFAVMEGVATTGGDRHDFQVKAWRIPWDR